jgi:hypothetical protein
MCCLTIGTSYAYITFSDQKEKEGGKEVQSFFVQRRGGRQRV